jgi:adenine-specific DNA-methyltransferase
VDETRRLQEALRGWRAGNTEALLSALGFERLGLRVPDETLADFGLDPSEKLNLEVAARRKGFHVFRIVLGERLDPEAIRRVAAALYRHNPARRALLIFEASGEQRLVLASWGLGPGPLRLRKLWIELDTPRRSELDILAALAANGATTASDLALAHIQALDREQVTGRFFAEFKRQRAALAAGLTDVPENAAADRLDLALILLSRLLFLYFLQRKGWLDHDTAYLRRVFEDALATGTPFFRRRLEPLFFGALNRPAERRGRSARALGELPYLNGGLFERDALERKYPRLDVPDERFTPIFHELLDRYQFTLREDQPADQDVAVDPEMLGRVFEGLMAGSVRGSTGAFFTPRTLVDRLVDGALCAHFARAADCERDLVGELISGGSPSMEESLRTRLTTQARAIRVLDPAVGSGAFLLAALHRLESLRDGLEGRPPDPFTRFERRQEIIRRNLHGVDINGAAVRLCELRLWLALVVDLELDDISMVPALPNLDINIRQGDALVDPIDFLMQHADLDRGLAASRWRRRVARLSERRDRYFRASGSGKRRVLRGLQCAERDLAVSFLAELAAGIDARRGDLRAAARSRDLFGKRAGLSRSQKKAAVALKKRRGELRRLLKKIREEDELPFFSFPIHFADPESPEPRFHVVLGNPPWIRSHHWSGLSRHRLKERFLFLRGAGWRAGSRLAGAGRGFAAQLDLSALFLERSLGLLAENGALGLLLPAKLTRTLAAGALRARLATSTRILSLEDCALAPQRHFEATTYPLALLLTHGEPDAKQQVSIRVHNRGGATLDFRLPQARLPLIDDPEAPWALAPPRARAALERMDAAGSPIGSHRERRPRRGIVTGVNELFLGRVTGDDSAPGRATIDLAGSLIEIETDRLRPALRGEDLAAWRFSAGRALIWTHDDEGQPLPNLPPATRDHLSRHVRALEKRIDLRPGQPFWTLFRTRPEKWALRVAWRDIAPEPGAAVVPPRVPFLDGTAPLISLNTVYQIPAASDEDAHFLAAVLNSTVARSYLKAIAERATGGYFRFLGWTVALLPFPEEPDAAVRMRCIELSRHAHATGGLTAGEHRRLDELVARLYGLGARALSTLRSFDARLSNMSDA